MVELPLWQSHFVIPAAAVDVFLAALETEGISIAAFEEPTNGEASESWRVELIHDTEPDRRGLTDRLTSLAKRSGLGPIEVTVRRVPTTDWLERTAADFPPQQIGRFWVHGSHVQEAEPPGSTPIEVDAGLAFGSGEHQTTHTCLLALDELARRRRFGRVLDLGCGSGILAIAAAKCWPARVIAADNDPVAVGVAQSNCVENGVAGRVRCVHSDGYAAPLVRATGPYDLILANILANPLCAMAPALSRCLAPGGTAILSGLLDTQASQVIAAHHPYQLQLRTRRAIGPWVTLVMARRRP
jgi:ribosomal protein L11 methyltransferase